MKYKVLRYNETMRCHECTLADATNGQIEYIDLMTDGGAQTDDPTALIGETVEMDYHFPYVSVAMHVRLASKSAGGL